MAKDHLFTYLITNSKSWLRINLNKVFLFAKILLLRPEHVNSRQFYHK